MADLFISYSREDKDRADQVARGMQAAGFDVFWDPDIPPGQTWADYIEDKLTVCAAVIVLWSQHSVKSQWVREEARMGRERGKLIPASLDDSQPPFGFGEVQAANLSDWRGQTSGHTHWERLVAAVRVAVERRRPAGAAPAAEPAPVPPAPPAPPPRPSPPPAIQPAAAMPSQAPRAAPAPAAPEQRRGGVNPLLLIGGLVAAAVVLGVIVFNTSAFRGAGPSPVQGVAAAGAGGQDYGAQIQGRLAQVAQVLGGQGFRQMGDPVQSRLPQGANEQIPLALAGGGESRIIGVCDNDCRDLDLSLMDQAGNVVAQDNGTDATPVITIPAGVAGQYVINASMYGCTVNPCFYAVVLYSR